MIRARSLGPTKIVIGLLMVVIGSFLTIFAALLFVFSSFGGLEGAGLVAVGLILLFLGLWMVLQAAFADVEVRVENLDELAAVMGKRVIKCKKCDCLNPAGALFCMRCGEKLT